jgi:hypothetical protein
VVWQQRRSNLVSTFFFQQSLNLACIIWRFCSFSGLGGVWLFGWIPMSKALVAALGLRIITLYISNIWCSLTRPKSALSPQGGFDVDLGLRVTLGHSGHRLSHKSCYPLSSLALAFLTTLMLTQSLQQRRRKYCLSSYGSYVVGIHYCNEKESSTELRSASQQHP